MATAAPATMHPIKVSLINCRQLRFVNAAETFCMRCQKLTYFCPQPRDY